MIPHFRVTLAVCLCCFSLISLAQHEAADGVISVADSITRSALAGVSVFDRNGTLVGICDSRGRMPYVSETSYPLTFRCIGYKEKTVRRPPTSAILLSESLTELPEFKFISRRQKVLYIPAYIREYSTLSTYTDTVYMFREKMVDFMIVPDKSVRYRGWSVPRTNKSRSYYRFSNADGLDSVSDKCNNHFTWSDWVGLTSVHPLPPELAGVTTGTQTVMGRYSPSETWNRENDRITIDLDILAENSGRRWVPTLSAFFKDNLDFECFRMKLLYDNIVNDSISPENLTAYSYNLETRGRGHKMFMFHKVDEPFFVSTYAEVYILDKEYISVKEAKKRERSNPEIAGMADFDIPSTAPALHSSVIELIGRVNSINNNEVRAALAPDRKLVGIEFKKMNFGGRLLQLLKAGTGLDGIRGARKVNKKWKELKQKRKAENQIIRFNPETSLP
ncbi:MAG: hypothetical protein K2M79_03540 [Muribaculaceae bacterium]|nr:hypothetical protein [Muribaculaceae bacterium]